MRDLSDALGRIAAAERHDGPLDLTAVIAQARSRRRRFTATVAVAGTAAAALVVAGTATAAQLLATEPLPPAEPTATAEPSPVTSPEHTATPPEGVAWVANLSRCGMAGDTWLEADQADADNGVWAGTYWGPDASAGNPVLARTDAIWDEDLGGQEMAVEVLDAVVVADLGWDEDGQPITGPVVAVLGEQVPTTSVELTSGSEGGGSGSHGGIELTLPLAVCDGSEVLPDGTYQVVQRLALTAGGTTVEEWAVASSYVGEPEQPEQAEATEVVFPPAAAPEDTLACHGTVDHLHEAALTGSTFAAGLAPGFTRVDSSAVLDWTSTYGLTIGLGGIADTVDLAIMAVAVSPFEAGDTPLEGHAVDGRIGTLTGVKTGAPIEWTAPIDGRLSAAIPISACGFPAGTALPDGLYVVHVHVAVRYLDLVDSFWTEDLIAIGDVELP